MKRIIAAWIEQILEFPTVQEYEDYLVDLKGKPGKYKVIDTKQDGQAVTIRVMKQYNKNAFPDEVQKGAKQNGI